MSLKSVLGWAIGTLLTGIVTSYVASRIQSQLDQFFNRYGKYAIPVATIVLACSSLYWVIRQVHKAHTRRHLSAKAKTLADEGYSAYIRGKNEVAAAKYQQALELFETCGDQEGQLSTLSRQNGLYVLTREITLSRQTVEKSVQLADRLKSPASDGEALRQQAKLAVLENRLGDAEALYRHSISKSVLAQSRTTQAKAQYGLATVLVQTSRFEEAITNYDSALALFREQNDKLGIAQTLVDQGDAFKFRGHLKEAEQNYADAIPLFEEVGEKLGQANARLSQGELKQQLHKLKDAESEYVQALRLFQSEGNQTGRANALVSYADLLVRLGKLDIASSKYDLALELLEKAGHLLGRANASVSYAELCILRKDLTKASRLTNFALTVYTRSDLVGKAFALKLQADIQVLKSRLGSAAKKYEEAVEKALQADAYAYAAEGLLGQSDLLLGQNQLEGAKVKCEEAIEYFTREQDEIGSAKSRSRLGLVLLASGEKDKALTACQDAVLSFQKMGHLPEQAFALERLSRVYAQRGERAEAEGCAAESKGLLRSMALPNNG